MTKGRFWKILKKFNNPPGMVAVITYLTTLLICPLTVFAVFYGKWKGLIAFFACTLSLALFAYMVIVSVTSLRRIKQKIVLFIDRNDFVKKF